MLQLWRWKACLQLLFLDAVVLDLENRDMDFSRVSEPSSDSLESTLWQTQRAEPVGCTARSRRDRRQRVSSYNSRRKGTEVDSCSSVFLWHQPNGEHCWPSKCPVLNSVVSQTAFSGGCVPFNTDTGVWFERLQWGTYDMHLRKRHGNKWSSMIVSLILASAMGCRHRALHFHEKASLVKALQAYSPSVWHGTFDTKSIAKIIACKYRVRALCWCAVRKSNLSKTNLEVKAETTQTNSDTGINPGACQEGERKTSTKGQPSAKFRSRWKDVLPLQWLAKS